MNVLYVIDTETTGTDPQVHEIIELSMLRLSDNEQKTFYLQPNNFSAIQADALRVNGHKLEDLKKGFRVHEDGSKDVYCSQEKAIVQIEQFLMDDLSTAVERVMVGHNVNFDKEFLMQLWKRCGQSSTYPFGRMYLDTMQIAVFLDYVSGVDRKAYHLGGLVKDMEIKKERAHRADADVRMTKDVFFKQVSIAKNGMKA